MIGEGRFDVAAGKTKRVRVKIAKAARYLFAGGRTVRATAVVHKPNAARSIGIQGVAAAVTLGGD